MRERPSLKRLWASTHSKRSHDPRRSNVIDGRWGVVGSIGGLAHDGEGGRANEGA